MRKIIYLAMIFCLTATLAHAQKPSMQPKSEPATAAVTAPAAATPETMTIQGDIIDNMCANSQKPENLAAFVKTHTKSCALMPTCAASGYSIYANGKLQGFDNDSNAKIEAFLKTEGSKLQVVATTKKTEDKLSLVSIENQK